MGHRHALQLALRLRPAHAEVHGAVAALFRAQGTPGALAKAAEAYRRAAQLEGSKTFSKAFLSRHGIATAAYADFTDIQSAKDYIRKQP